MIPWVGAIARSHERPTGLIGRFHQAKLRVSLRPNRPVPLLSVLRSAGSTRLAPQIAISGPQNARFRAPAAPAPRRHRARAAQPCPTPRHALAAKSSARSGARARYSEHLFCNAPSRGPPNHACMTTSTDTQRCKAATCVVSLLYFNVIVLLKMCSSRRRRPNFSRAQLVLTTDHGRCRQPLRTPLERAR